MALSLKRLRSLPKGETDRVIGKDARTNDYPSFGDIDDAVNAPLYVHPLKTPTWWII